MLAIVMTGPAVQASGVLGWICALAVAASAYALAARVPDGWRSRLLIAVLVAGAIATVAATAAQAAVYYDLTVYCSWAWWDWFTCGW